MSQHQRLRLTMRSPARAARRAKKLRRQAKCPQGRPREYAASQLPASWLAGVWNNPKASA